jgi:hypothetical protein
VLFAGLEMGMQTLHPHFKTLQSSMQHSEHCKLRSPYKSLDVLKKIIDEHYIKYDIEALHFQYRAM